MLYLKAGTEIKPLEEWKDEKGNFAKIFLINDQRNKNEWRATWESIKKNAQDFIGKPGIEYIKCVDGECDLDHTDAPTYAQNLKVQEPFRVSTIIDIILNENTHTAFAIHEIHDCMFAEKLQHKKVKYVSPSIWPKEGQYEIIGKKANGELVIDVFAWYGLHSAFVNKPAFGDDAKVVAQCSDHKDACMMRMLTAKELIADELDPLKEVPLMVKHKGYHTFVSVSECVRDIIQKKIDDGINVTDQDLTTAYSECGQTKKACNCQKAAIVSLKHRVGILDLKMRINNLSSKIKFIAGDEKNDKKGIWVTSNGQHIFIPDGKDKGDAVKEHFKKLKDKADIPNQPKKSENNKTISVIRDKLKDVSHNTADEFFHSYDTGVPWNPQVPDFNIEKFNQKHKKKLDIIHSPSGEHSAKMVLSEDDLVIDAKSLNSYNEILSDAISQSPKLQKFQQKVDDGNKIISDELKRTNTVHRGANFGEISFMIQNDGKVGYHKREQYGKSTDFVSTSIDTNVSKKFADNNPDPIQIEFDVSQMDKSDYNPIHYKLRRDVKVKDGNNEFRPYEKFAGIHSAIFMSESEVQIRKGAKPIVRSVNINYPTNSEERKNIENTISKLESINNKKIKIIYDKDK